MGAKSKPQTRLVRPPKVDADTVERFVGGGEEESPRPKIQRGDPKRARLIYLSPEVDRKLRSYCALEDKKISHVIQEAVERFLSEGESESE